jgi:hypothetical protein
MTPPCKGGLSLGFSTEGGFPHCHGAGDDAEHRLVGQAHPLVGERGASLLLAFLACYHAVEYLPRYGQWRSIASLRQVLGGLGIEITDCGLGLSA